MKKDPKRLAIQINGILNAPEIAFAEKNIGGLGMEVGAIILGILIGLVVLGLYSSSLFFAAGGVSILGVVLIIGFLTGGHQARKAKREFFAYMRNNREQIIDILEESLEYLFEQKKYSLKQKTMDIFILMQTNAMTYAESSKEYEYAQKTVEEFIFILNDIGQNFKGYIQKGLMNTDY